MNIYDNIHEAYLGTLFEIYHDPEVISSPRGQRVKEILDYQFRILNPMAESIITYDPERNKVIADYTKKECDLYDSCSNDVEDFVKASKFWGKLANPDGTVNSAYGHLIWGKHSAGNPWFESGSSRPQKSNAECKRTPWQWAKESLITDKDSRQAILRFSLPEHQWVGNRDQVCTMHGNFLIRKDKLHLSIVMRSNDLTLGLVYDLPWFISLMDKMIGDLKYIYPNLSKGHYTHTVHSLHIYDRDEKRVRKMLGLEV